MSDSIDTSFNFDSIVIRKILSTPDVEFYNNGELVCTMPLNASITDDESTINITGLKGYLPFKYL